MPGTTDSPEKYCVIGAGPSGLAVVKALADRGLGCECFEREDEVGGNWNFVSRVSSVYDSTHLISSKRLTQFRDFPMPGDYPAFPHRQQVHEYLRAYAERFDLYPHIRFNSGVAHIEPADGHWQVELEDGTCQAYRGVLIANGHHWDPQWPDFPGSFAGEIIHSQQYKSPVSLSDKRVLVVGAGNSACDIAVEAAQHAKSALLSVRRGYHFLPKFLFGKPIDETGITLQRMRLPLWLRRQIAAVFSTTALGKPHRVGLPKPDHRLFESHPIVNSQLFYYLGHGRLRVKPNVAQLAGNEVRFEDDSVERVDLIIYATGYRVSFPFIDPQHLNWHDGLPQLYAHAFHPQRDDLFVIGMIQPNGGLWPLAELQAKIAANFLAASSNGNAAADWFRKLKSKPTRDFSGGIHFLPSPRHRLEVDYFTYRQFLRRLLRRFEGL